MEEVIANKQRGRSRLPITQRKATISVGFTIDEIMRLEVMAEEKGQSRSELIRTLVTKGLTKHELYLKSKKKD